MFIEFSSFAASVIAGTVVVNTGLALLGCATPVGGMELVVGGLAVAGTAAVASIGVNGYTQNNSGSLYDDIMKWINF